MRVLDPPFSTLPVSARLTVCVGVMLHSPFVLRDRAAPVLHPRGQGLGHQGQSLCPHPAEYGGADQGRGGRQGLSGPARHLSGNGQKTKRIANGGAGQDLSLILRAIAAFLRAISWARRNSRCLRGGRAPRWGLPGYGISRQCCKLRVSNASGQLPEPACWLETGFSRTGQTGFTGRHATSRHYRLRRQSNATRPSASKTRSTASPLPWRYGLGL